jgi:hypothetical protein
MLAAPSDLSSTYYFTDLKKLEFFKHGIREFNGIKLIWLNHEVNIYFRQ